MVETKAKLRHCSGVTLVALVVTVLVMLILAGVVVVNVLRK